jgi:hypothetical protein
VRDDPPANGEWLFTNPSSILTAHLDDEELGPFSIGSPSSPILSPCNSDELLSPPSYPHSNAILDGRPHDWKTDIPDVGIAPMKIFSAPSYEMPVDDDQDMTYEPNYHPPSGGKVRSPHRKAIEEKSSMKRKQAEQRLSQIITRRLGGTFVPGLANQLNHAAELLEYVLPQSLSIMLNSTTGRMIRKFVIWRRKIAASDNTIKRSTSKFDNASTSNRQQILFLATLMPVISVSFM